MLTNNRNDHPIGLALHPCSCDLIVSRLLSWRVNWTYIVFVVPVWWPARLFRLWCNVYFIVKWKRLGFWGAYKSLGVRLTVINDMHDNETFEYRFGENDLSLRWIALTQLVELIAYWMFVAAKLERKMKKNALMSSFERLEICGSEFNRSLLFS